MTPTHSGVCQQDAKAGFVMFDCLTISFDVFFKLDQMLFIFNMFDK